MITYAPRKVSPLLDDVHRSHRFNGLWEQPLFGGEDYVCYGQLVVMDQAIGCDECGMNTWNFPDGLEPDDPACGDPNPYDGVFDALLKRHPESCSILDYDETPPVQDPGDEDDGHLHTWRQPMLEAAQSK